MDYLALIIIAWIGAMLGALCWLIPRRRLLRAHHEAAGLELMAPIVAVSALLLYEDLATAMFSQPVTGIFI